MTDTDRMSKQDIARFILDPRARGTLTLQDYAGTQWEDAGFDALANELEQQINATCEGNKTDTCRTLVVQATILDMVFQTLCRKAIITEPYGQNFFNAEYLHLALKCQKQAAATTAMLQYLLPEDQKNQNELLKNMKGGKDNAP